MFDEEVKPAKNIYVINWVLDMSGVDPTEVTSYTDVVYAVDVSSAIENLRLSIREGVEKTNTPSEYTPKFTKYINSSIVISEVITLSRYNSSGLSGPTNQQMLGTF